MTNAAMARARASDAAKAMNGLRRMVRALRSGNSAMERATGISSAQLFALRQIAREPGQSLSDLAGSTLTTPSSVSEVVTRLVQRGLVERKIAGDDRRRIELEATRTGRALLANAPESTQERLLTGLLTLSASRQRTLAAALEAWLAAAGLERVEPAMFFEDDA